jgi:Domain of unknown function (DUF4276)
VNVVKYVEFLVEEPSTEAALRALLPRVLAPALFEVFVHRSKADLLKRLPDRLAGYSRRRAGDGWFRDHARIVVLLDRDDDDCLVLKRHIAAMARQAGLSTTGPSRALFIRIAIEELEAWYFGDWSAVRAAYPAVSPHVPLQARFRDPDAIAGGTWEAFERVMQRAGHFSGGLRKVAAAREIATRMDPAVNTSHSFRVFWQALHDLLAA